MKKFTCLVCGFGDLNESPYDSLGLGSDEICPACGFHYGFDDDPYACGGQPLELGKEEMRAVYRKNWITNGVPWFSHRTQPENWDPKQQLKNIGIEVE